MVRSGGVEVVNADDPAWAGLPRRNDVRRVTYGTTAPADVRVVDIKLGRAAAMRWILILFLDMIFDFILDSISFLKIRQDQPAFAQATARQAGFQRFF
jgi:hypothetical protein